MASACGAVYHARLGGLGVDRLTLSGPTGLRIVHVLYGFNAHWKYLFSTQCPLLSKALDWPMGNSNADVLYYVTLCNLKQTLLGDH